MIIIIFWPAGAILNGGVLLPFGGYKGSHIAMAVELLAGLN
jgi:LDH2 family malate/lactate/ureidoglycolate dehydrogenase